jgi:hypothetical protein
VLNGAQLLQSTSTHADIVTNAAKLLYIPIVASAFVNDNIIFRPVGTQFAIMTTATGFRFRNFDGSNDDVEIAANVNQVYILRARQASGQIEIALDSGAGFVAATPVASGNNTGTAGALQIGSTTISHYGKIGGIFTANTGLAKPNFENLLREYYFARSLIEYDPITSQLVVRRA